MIGWLIELYSVRIFLLKSVINSDSSCFRLSNTFFRNPICPSTHLNFSDKRNTKCYTTSIKYSKYRIYARNSHSYRKDFHSLHSGLLVQRSSCVAMEGLAKEIPEISHYIDLGVAKIMEYVSKGRRSRIYALAMGTTKPSVTLPSTDCLP